MLTHPTLILGYARVSTAEQAYESSLNRQALRLRTSGATQVYADVASRTKDDRSGLMALLEVVRSREVNQVIVTRIDRLTASPGLFDLITKEFQKYSVTLQVLDEDIDIDSVDGELLAGLKVLLARREVRMGGLRTTSSREPDKKKNGANPCTPWGYRYVDGRYQLDHTPYLCLLLDRPEGNKELTGRTKAQLGRDVVNLFFEAGTLSSACRVVHEKYGIQKFVRPKKQQKFYVFTEDVKFCSLENKRAGVFSWSRDGIRHYLNNPVLCGHTPYNIYKKQGKKQISRAPQTDWDIRYNTHPDQILINDGEKRQLTSMLTTNRSLGGWGLVAALPLTGLLVCGYCGRTMKCKGMSETGKRYYQCKNYLERACSHKKTIRMDVAESAVIAALTQRAGAIATLAATPDEHVEPPELIQLRSQLAGMEALGRNPAIEVAIAALRSQIESNALAQIQRTVVNQEQQQQLTQMFADPTCWECSNLSDTEKRQVFRDLVRKVIIRDGAVVDVDLKV